MSELYSYPRCLAAMLETDLGTQLPLYVLFRDSTTACGQARCNCAKNVSCSCFVGEGMLWYAVLGVCGVVGVCVALAAGGCGVVGVCVALAAGVCGVVGVCVALAAGVCGVVGVCVALAAGVCGVVGVCVALAAGVCGVVCVCVAPAAGVCGFVGVCVSLAVGVCGVVCGCGVLGKVLAASVLRFCDAEVKSISRIRWNGDANFAGVGNS